MSQNAKGDQSKARSFYRTQKRLLSFHYQCSRRSTSTEIEAVFKRAEDKQRTTHGDTACFVFMDEAGLPEEQRESLKVLHYYLEDHMSRPAKVGFVAITNHALDAAKSNRCAILLRAEPDHRELMEICRGCLGSEAEQRRVLAQQVVGLDLRVPEALESLCSAYQDLMREVELSWFNTFFGLRDFMHFIKLLARLSTDSTVSLEKIVHALERNMSGEEEAKLQGLINFWRRRLGVVSDLGTSELRNPFTLLRESLAEQAQSERPISRYKLLIDTTVDDSILRLLHARRDLDVSTCDQRGSIILKLSDFREDTGLQQVTLVSSVKTAAEKGEVVVLSHTEPVNESFYDLFNQHWIKMEDREPRVLVGLSTSPKGVRVSLGVGNVATASYHANIAVGSHSKLCRVNNSFQCIVQLRLSELRNAPAPFLHRFEKYRLSHRNLLDAHLQSSPGLRMLVAPVLEKMKSFVDRIEPLSLYGYKSQQTIESIILRLASRHMGSNGEILPTASIVTAAAVELRDDPEALELLHNGTHEGSQLKAMRFFAAPTKEASSAESRVAVAITGQWLLQTAVSQVLLVCTPERLYKHRASLPADVLETYFSLQEHFSLKRLLRSVVTQHTRKLVVYTRTTASLLALPAHGLETTDDESTVANIRLLEALICEDFELPMVDGGTKTITLADFALCPLSLLTTQEALIACLRFFRSPASTKRVLLFFINMAETPTSRVNFVRSKVDELFSDAEGTTLSVVLVMHFPASNVYVQPCYDTTFCDEWQTVFLDSISEEASALGALDVSEWMKLGASTEGLSLVDTARWDLMPALVGWLHPALTTAASRIEFARGRSPGGFNPADLLSVQARIKLLETLMFHKLRDSRDGEATVHEVLCTRYSQLWTADDHRLIRDRVQSATHMLASGQLRVSLVEAITGEVREAFCNYLTLMICKMNEQLNLDLLDDDHLDQHVEGIFLRCLQCLPIPPVPELKLLTQPRRLVASIPPPPTSEMFPFFSIISDIFDQATNEALATAEGRDLSEDDALAAVEDKIRNSDAPLAEVAHIMAGIGATSALPRVLLNRYFAHSVSQLFSDSPQVEQRMIIAWLDNRCHSIDPKRPVIALHVAVHRHEKMIQGFATMLRPLGMLMDDMGAQSSLLFEEDMMKFGIDYATSDANLRMHTAIIQEFYRQMEIAINKSEQDPQQATMWARAFGVVELRDLVVDSQGSNIPDNATRLLIMSVVHAAAKDLQGGSDCEALRRFAQEAEKAIGADLRLEQIWRVTHELFPQHTSLMQHILQLWCSTARFESSPLKPEVRSDVEFLLNTLVHEQQLTETLRTSILESLLSSSKLVGALCDYNVMERGADKSSSAEVLELLERHLVDQMAGLHISQVDLEHAYVPLWFDQADAKLDRPVAHAYFHVVLKQMLLLHGSFEELLILYSKLKDQLDEMHSRGPDAARQARLRRLERSGPLRVPHLRAITLTACRLSVVLQLGTRLAAIAKRERDPREQLLSAEEEQLVSDQPSLRLESIVQSHPQWGFELMNSLACELRSRETMMEFMRADGRRLLPAILHCWAETPPAAERHIGLHAKLAFAFDSDHALHMAYRSLADAMGDRNALVQEVRQVLAEDATERRRLDVVMMLFAASYYERGTIDARAVLAAVKELRASLGLADHAMRIFERFLQPETLIAIPEGNMASDSLCDLMKTPPEDLDRSERELQSCIIGMVALTLGSNEATTHLATHIFRPSALPGTFGVGNQYANPIGNYHYDCGSELTEDGEIPNGRPQRAPLDRHSLYFVMWASFTALGVSLVTQQESQQVMPAVIAAPGQGLRSCIHTFLRAPWQHLGSKLHLDAEGQCQLVLRALEHFRERTLARPGEYASVFRSIREVQRYERLLMESFHDARQRLPDYVAALRRREAATQLWKDLDTFSTDHPPLQVAVRHSSSLVAQSVIFADELELLSVGEGGQEMAVLLAFTRKCYSLRFLWVLPDLVELYQFLHTHLEHILFEEKSKQLSMGELLESMRTNRGSMRFSQDDARHITQLWLRVKTGFNQFVEANRFIGVGACAGRQEAEAAEAAANAQRAAQVALAAMTGGDAQQAANAARAAADADVEARRAEQRLTRITPIEDSQPLWRFLSSHDDERIDSSIRFKDETLAGDSLFLVIKRMIGMHNELVQDLCDHGLTVAPEPIRPLELSAASVALGDVRPWDLQLGVDTSKNLAQQAVQMAEQVKSGLLQLDQSGSFAKTVQVHMTGSRTFDFSAIRREVSELFLNRLVKVDDPSTSLRRTFRFRTLGSGVTSGDEAMAKAARLQHELGRLGASQEIEEDEAQGLQALYFRMFHSLEHEQLAKLLRGLDLVVTTRLQAVSADEDVTVRKLLGEMFPAVGNDVELLQRVHIELHEEEQCNTLLQVRFSQLSTLVQFLRSHLALQDYIFARVPFKLKEHWGDDVIVALDEIERTYDQNASEEGLPLAAAAVMLEQGIVDYEQIFASDPEAPLHRFMILALGSEQVLYSELPLMRVLPGGIAARHYVELRKLLHRWAHRPAATAPVTERWSWPFFFHSQEVTSSEVEVMGERSKDIASRWVLWFESSSDLVDAEASAQVRDWLDGIISQLTVAERRTQLLTSTAAILQDRWRGVLRHRRQRAEEAAAQAAHEAAQTALARLQGASDDELPGAIAAARPHVAANTKLAELLPEKQIRVAEVERQRSEMRRKALQRVAMSAAVAFAVLAICIPLLVRSGSVLESPLLDLTEAAPTVGAVTQVELQLDDGGQTDPSLADDGLTSEVMGAVEADSNPWPLRSETSHSEVAAAPAIVEPDFAADAVGDKGADRVAGRASRDALGFLEQLDTMLLASVLVAAASWLIYNRPRHNVRDRLSDLVALREAGLVSEHNYLEREREILQEI